MKKFITIKKRKDDDSYMIENHKKIFLGDIYQKQIGRSKQWVFESEPPCYIEDNTWWTSECLEQILNKLKELENGNL